MYNIKNLHIYIKTYAWYSKTKHKFNLRWKRIAAQFYVRRSVDQTTHHISNKHNKLQENDWIIMTVAYNSYDTIVEQWKLLNKHVLEEFEYVVVDNSSDDSISKELYRFCLSHDITYFRLDGNPYNNFIGGISHGLALNWGYQNHIKFSQAGYFGMLDHDVYPTKRISLTKNMYGQKIYGLAQARDEKWYLWPGYSFFSLNMLKTVSVNFAPIPGTDTGGGNWESIYKYYDMKKLKLATHSYQKYTKGNFVQETSVEYLDSWVHFMAVSGWMSSGKPKDIYTIFKQLKRRRS